MKTFDNISIKSGSSRGSGGAALNSHAIVQQRTRLDSDKIQGAKCGGLFPSMRGGGPDKHILDPKLHGDQGLAK